MINYIEGNILESDAEALVNTVNTVGVMGKGIALQFKNAFPKNFNEYFIACKRKEIDIGKLLVIKDHNLNFGEKYIINFPTKKDWRKSSEYVYIEQGLDDLVRIIKDYNIKSIAIPPLGAGNGGLEWGRVKQLLFDKLDFLNIDICIYEPTNNIKEFMKTERVKLTKSSALLLYVLYDLVGYGEFVSEFSSEKICYFLQKFGAKKYFNLTFEPKFYGPYSGKVRYILNRLNGSYIMGYSDMNKNPFEPLFIIKDGCNDVIAYIENDEELNEIAIKTTKYLKGFYGDYALELMSSIDFVITENHTYDRQTIIQKMLKWNDRKGDLISNEEDVDHVINYIQKNDS